MADLNKTLREAMRQQTLLARQFSARWATVTAWQHKIGAQHG